MDLISEIQKTQKELFKSKEKFDQAQEIYDRCHSTPRKNFQFSREIDYSATKSFYFTIEIRKEMPCVDSLMVEDFVVKQITYDIDDSPIYDQIRANRATVVPWIKNDYFLKRMLGSIRPVMYNLPQIIESITSTGVIHYLKNKDGGTVVNFKELIDRLDIPGFSDNIMDWTPEQLLMIKMVM